MLKNIDPLLAPELLYVLRSMGHGDEIVIVGFEIAMFGGSVVARSKRMYESRFESRISKSTHHD